MIAVAVVAVVAAGPRAAGAVAGEASPLVLLKRGEGETGEGGREERMRGCGSDCARWK